MGIVNLFKSKNLKDDNIYVYTEDEMEQYEKYIEEHIGNFTNVMHEIVSPDIHVDIIVIPPTEEANYYKLVTMGMGAYKMNVPRELRKYNIDRAELVMYLPPTWNIMSDKEEDYWPIRQLKLLARLPLIHDTWLGFGHTVSSDENNTPYANNTKFCSIMLFAAVDKKNETLNLKIKSKGEINFYQVFPLYKEELEYSHAVGIDELLNLFPDEFIPVVDITRDNFCLDK